MAQCVQSVEVLDPCSYRSWFQARFNKCLWQWAAIVLVLLVLNLRGDGLNHGAKGFIMTVLTGLCCVGVLWGLRTSSTWLVHWSFIVFALLQVIIHFQFAISPNKGAHTMHVVFDIVVLPLTKVPRMLVTEAGLWTLSSIFAGDVLSSTLFYLNVVGHSVVLSCLRALLAHSLCLVAYLKIRSKTRHSFSMAQGLAEKGVVNAAQEAPVPAKIGSTSQSGKCQAAAAGHPVLRGAAAQEAAAADKRDRRYQSRVKCTEATITLHGALTPEMISEQSIRRLMQEVNRQVPHCFVQNVAMRSGCVVLSFDVISSKGSARAVCKKLVDLAKDWAKTEGLEDPASKDAPQISGQAWDPLEQVMERVNDSGDIVGSSITSTISQSNIDATRLPHNCRLTLPTPSILMPPLEPFEGREGVLASRTDGPCAIMEMLAWVGLPESAALEVRGWEHPNNSPEDNEGDAGEGSVLMRLLACAGGSFLAVHVLRCQQEGDVWVLEVQVSLPTHILEGGGCPMVLQLWQGGCMLCSSVALLLPHALGHLHTEISEWIAQEQRQLQQEGGSDCGMLEFVSDLSEWLQFQHALSTAGSCSGTAGNCGGRHPGGGRSAEEAEAVCMMQDVGADLLHHCLRCGLHGWSGLLLRGLASPPFNLPKAAIAADPALQEEPRLADALASSSAAASGEGAGQEKEVKEEEEAPSMHEQQQQQQQRRRQRKKQANVCMDCHENASPVLALTRRGALEGSQPPSPSPTKSSAHPPSYSAWLICKNKHLVARWAVTILVVCTLHLFHPSCTLHARVLIGGMALAESGIATAALRGKPQMVRLLVLCVVLLQLATIQSMASTAESPALHYYLDVSNHLVTTVPFMLILELHLFQLPLIVAANITVGVRFYQNVVGHTQAMAIFRAASIQMLCLMVYTAIRQKAKAAFAAQQDVGMRK